MMYCLQEAKKTALCTEYLITIMKCSKCGKFIPPPGEFHPFFAGFGFDFYNDPQNFGSRFHRRRLSPTNCKNCETVYPPLEFKSGEPIKMPKCSFCETEMEPPKGPKCQNCGAPISRLTREVALSWYNSNQLRIKLPVIIK